MNKVCPDHQLLSVYFDGELPSPWKEKMESHLAVCPHCAKQLQTYQNMRLAACEEETALVSAKERVWQKLEQGNDSADGGSADDNAVKNWRRSYPGNGAVWRRRISIPIPVAAAAVVMMGVLAFFMGIRVMGAPENPGMAGGMTFASEAEFDMPGIISASDMENLMQFFDNRDTSDTIILHLPEFSGFDYGEPAILTAADYSRQMTGWRK